MIPYPSDVPKPSIDYTPRTSDGVQWRLQMSSGRTRQGLITTTESEDVQLSWTFTPEQFAKFMLFWEVDLTFGAAAFDVTLISGAKSSTSRITAKADTLAPAFSGNLWRVSCQAVLFQVPEPLPLPPPIGYGSSAFSSGGVTRATYSIKLTTIYYNWSNTDRDSWGKTAETITDSLTTDEHGTPVDPLEPAISSSGVTNSSYSIKKTIKRIDPLFDSFSGDLIGGTSDGYKSVRREDPLFEGFVGDIHNVSYSLEKDEA